MKDGVGKKRKEERRKKKEERKMTIIPLPDLLRTTEYPPPLEGWPFVGDEGSGWFFRESQDARFKMIDGELIDFRELIVELAFDPQSPREPNPQLRNKQYALRFMPLGEYKLKSALSPKSARDKSSKTQSPKNSSHKAYCLKHTASSKISQIPKICESLIFKLSNSQILTESIKRIAYSSTQSLPM